MKFALSTKDGPEGITFEWAATEELPGEATLGALAWALSTSVRYAPPRRLIEWHEHGIRMGIGITDAGLAMYHHVARQGSRLIGFEAELELTRSVIGRMEAVITEAIAAHGLMLRFIGAMTSDHGRRIKKVEDTVAGLARPHAHHASEIRDYADYEAVTLEGVYRRVRDIEQNARTAAHSNGHRITPVQRRRGPFVRALRRIVKEVAS